MGSLLRQPPILYHYIDTAGLMGIVANPSFANVYADAGVDLDGAIELIASDVRSMNDHPELRYAGHVGRHGDSRPNTRAKIYVRNCRISF